MSKRPTGTVTFLFTDIEGSTHLWEQSPDAMKAALVRHDTLLRQNIETNGGYVFKTIGDAFCAVFTNAPEALVAALAAQRALHFEAWPPEIGSIRIRAALHTGAAEERDGDYFGPPLNRVARLLSAGHGDQTLLSLATQELVRDSLPAKASLIDLGEHRLRDLFRPERVFQVTAPDLPSEFPPLKTLDAKRTNLPAQPTPFIGRERELAAVLALMRQADVRLATLTGPGGVGKTRLSLQVAADLLDDYEHGVWFVSLAGISDPELVLPAIGSALGVHESGGETLAETLKRYLNEKEILLVLDNFEQVTPAARSIGDLLSVAPKLKVIASSREKLRVYGEHEYVIPPLALPNLKRKETVAMLSQYEAVSLFIQRAKAANPAFTMTDDNAPAVAEICVKLDGLPLAIELVAARAKLLKPQAMLDRLNDRLRMLTGGARDLPARQQAIRNTVDWSYDLLTADEMILFARLGVFVGGWTLEVAEAVCRGEPVMEVLAGLESLLDKSLIRQMDGGGESSRFSMLEIIRDYASEKLHHSGEAATIRKRHAQCFTTLLEDLWAAYYKSEEVFPRTLLLTEDLDNFRAAFEWSIGHHEPELALTLCGLMDPLFGFRSAYREEREWLERALPLAHQVSPRVRASLLLAAGQNASIRGDMDAAVAFHSQSLDLCRQLGEPRAIAGALSDLGNDLIVSDPERAAALFEEALNLHRELNFKHGMMMVLGGLAELARAQGDLLKSRQYTEQAVDQTGDSDTGLAGTHYGNLGQIDLAEGDFRQARLHFIHALALVEQAGWEVGVSWYLVCIAAVLGSTGQPERAARLLGAGEAMQERAGGLINAVDRTTYDLAISAPRKALGDAAFETLRAEGRALTLEQAVELALETSGEE